MQLGCRLLSATLERVPCLSSLEAFRIHYQTQRQYRARCAVKQMGKILEKVFHRAGVPPWLRHVVSQLR